MELEPAAGRTYPSLASPSAACPFGMSKAINKSRSLSFEKFQRSSLLFFIPQLAGNLNRGNWRRPRRAAYNRRSAADPVASADSLRHILAPPSP